MAEIKVKKLTNNITSIEILLNKKEIKEFTENLSKLNMNLMKLSLFKIFYLIYEKLTKKDGI
jgi:hypothetical protein